LQTNEHADNDYGSNAKQLLEFQVSTPGRLVVSDSQRLVTRRPTDNLKTLWEGSGKSATDLNNQTKIKSKPSP
jgi:hypothetical protein